MKGLTHPFTILALVAVSAFLLKSLAEPDPPAHKGTRVENGIYSASEGKSGLQADECIKPYFVAESLEDMP